MSRNYTICTNRHAKILFTWDSTWPPSDEGLLSPFKYSRSTKRSSECHGRLYYSLHHDKNGVWKHRYQGNGEWMEARFTRHGIMLCGMWCNHNFGWWTGWQLKPIGCVILTALALLALYRVRGIQRQGVWKEDFRRCIGKLEAVEEHCAVSWATSRENVWEKWFS